jgi:hypothetical protein
MTRQLSFSIAVLFAVACKTESPTPAGPAAKDPPASAARSPKIDVKPVLPPAAAAAPSDEPPRAAPNRDEWRKRRDERIDANGDGVVSDDERAAAIRERVANLRARLDTDGDGKVSPAELASARGRMRFDDPAALDTNHDGDISADELAAALKARRDQWRARNAGDGDGGGPGGRNRGGNRDPDGTGSGAPSTP